MAWDWEKLKEQQQGSGGPSMPPQMDELLQKLKSFKLPGMPGGPVIIVAILLALFFGSSTFFTIAVDEVGVVQRFGKYVRTSQPGLNFKMPAGIEKVTKVKIRRVYKEEFGFQSTRMDTGNTFSNTSGQNVSLMLTGDLNVALVPWIVQYRIKDPYNYLFKVRDPTRLLTDMSESAMRLVVGDSSINEVISKREELAIKAKNALQKEMDQAESGVHIVTVEMGKTNVPEPVQPSFNEVNQATQEKERLIYEAREEYNKSIPAARGQADRTIKTAEGYALDRVNRAQGDAARFTSIFTEYSKAKDVTKRRLYLEMMQALLPKIEEKYIIDADQNNVLPFLNLKGDSIAK